ncbi:hypothetical protein C6P41_000142 [Kluyveromyces marxianus]|nr:hypothetical protein C6P41_000142 [Kluyveromyces marxianus]
MTNSVRIKDYFDNDYNGLWSWYLYNLRKGEFEELTRNKLKSSLLKRFLREQLCEVTPLNKKLLLVSIPDDIHEDIKVLEEFLSEYFHLKDDHTNIVINKITRDTIYNHENHYLIQDELANFNDEWFLNMKRDVSVNNTSEEPDSPESCGITPENNLGSPTESQVSIMTHGEDLESYRGEALVHTITRTVEEVAEEATSNDDYDEDSVDDMKSNNVSIPPSISISDNFGTFRLVLQSILIASNETDQVFTGIRQSENDRSNADINDDWLLYDSEFNLDNLQMLSLQDIFEFSRLSPKILFYSMIHVKENMNTECSMSPDQRITMQNTISNGFLRTSTAGNNSSMGTGNSYSELSSENSIQEYTVDDDNDSIAEDPAICLYSPQTAATAGHRSIGTTESVGAWALNRSNTKRSMEYIDNSVSRDSRGNFVNRIKSQPMPVLLKSLSTNVDSETAKIKKSLAKSKARYRKKSSPNNCIIM